MIRKLLGSQDLDEEVRAIDLARVFWSRGRCVVHDVPFLENRGIRGAKQACDAGQLRCDGDPSNAYAHAHCVERYNSEGDKDESSRQGNRFFNIHGLVLHVDSSAQ